MTTKWEGVMATFEVNVSKQQLYDTLMEISQKDRDDIVCEMLCNDEPLLKKVLDMVESWKD